MTLPVATWKGTFRLFGVDVTCYVVDDKRIIDAESMARLLDAMANGTIDPEDNKDITAFASWRAGE